MEIPMSVVQLYPQELGDAMDRKPVWPRPVAVCVLRRGDQIFVFEGYDSTKDEVFYRPLGGTIEFGEYGHEAAQREILEEIDERVVDLRFVGVCENMFGYQGRRGHEIVLVYEGDFENESMYERETVFGREEDGSSFKALWKPIADFQDGKVPLYPDGLLALITR